MRRQSPADRRSERSETERGTLRHRAVLLPRQHPQPRHSERSEESLLWFFRRFLCGGCGLRRRLVCPGGFGFSDREVLAHLIEPLLADTANRQQVIDTLERAETGRASCRE